MILQDVEEISSSHSLTTMDPRSYLCCEFSAIIVNPSPWRDHKKQDQSEEHVVALLWWALKRYVCIRVLHGNWTLSIEVH